MRFLLLVSFFVAAALAQLAGSPVKWGVRCPSYAWNCGWWPALVVTPGGAVAVVHHDRTVGALAVTWGTPAEIRSGVANGAWLDGASEKHSDRAGVGTLAPAGNVVGVHCDAALIGGEHVVAAYIDATAFRLKVAVHMAQHLAGYWSISLATTDTVDVAQVSVASYEVVNSPARFLIAYTINDGAELKLVYGVPFTPSSFTSASVWAPAQKEWLSALPSVAVSNGGRIVIAFQRKGLQTLLAIGGDRPWRFQSAPVTVTSTVIGPPVLGRHSLAVVNRHYFCAFLDSDTGNLLMAHWPVSANLQTPFAVTVLGKQGINRGSLTVHDYFDQPTLSFLAPGSDQVVGFFTTFAQTADILSVIRAAQVDAALDPALHGPTGTSLATLPSGQLIGAYVDPDAPTNVSLWLPDEPYVPVAQIFPGLAVWTLTPDRGVFQLSTIRSGDSFDARAGAIRAGVDPSSSGLALLALTFGGPVSNCLFTWQTVPAGFDGPRVTEENTAPYAVFGRNVSDPDTWLMWSPVAGNYELLMELYFDSKTAFATQTFSFSVITDGTPSSTTVEPPATTEVTEVTTTPAPTPTTILLTTPAPTTTAASTTTFRSQPMSTTMGDGDLIVDDVPGGFGGLPLVLAAAGGVCVVVVVIIALLWARSRRSKGQQQARAAVASSSATSTSASLDHGGGGSSSGGRHGRSRSASRSRARSRRASVHLKSKDISSHQYGSVNAALHGEYGSSPQLPSAQVYDQVGYASTSQAAMYDRVAEQEPIYAPGPIVNRNATETYGLIRPANNQYDSAHSPLKSGPLSSGPVYDTVNETH